MYAYKDLLELAGLTTRLYTLLSTLHNLPPLPQDIIDPAGDISLSHVDVGVPVVAETSIDEKAVKADRPHLPLVKDLSFVLKEGTHLMITGSNGVGKTSVARVLAGLWPPVNLPSDSDSLSGSTVQEGHLRRPASTPARKAVCVVPQRAYMVMGTLFDQVIYPESYAEWKAKGGREEELMEILGKVFLAYLPEREGGWKRRKEWRDVLSGGEKQRVSLFSPVVDVRIG